jgi:hypothetical protein
MTPARQQIEKLEREIEKLITDSLTRLDKEHTLFLQKLAKIDAKIAALGEDPPPVKRKRKPAGSEQLSLLE